jgi:GNAT superfamily N-acetyltransferase
MGEIRLVRYSDILGAPNAAELISEYAQECVVQIDPQVEAYRAMERAGAFVAFGVYDGDVLVGFASVLMAVMPHDGRKVGTVESIFVSEGHRRDTGGSLMLALEDYAQSAGCADLLYTARVGSRMEWILSHRKKCRHTHSVHTRSFP